MDILALCDEDASYTSAFADYLNRKKVLAFDVYVFTKVDLLKDFLREKKVNVMIAGKEILNQVKEFEVDRKIVLSDGSSFSEGDEYSIYKFDSMEKIVGQISGMYGYLNTHNKNGFEGMIGVYSPYSMKGKLDFSLGYALSLSKKCKTLYINLEEFSGLGTYIIENESGHIKDLSDLMYEYEQMKMGNHVRYVENIYRKDELDVILPIRYAKDLRSIDSGVWGDAINKYAIARGYKRVVVDFGNMLEDPFYIMDICKVVYILTPSEPHEKKRMKEFVEYMLGSGNEKLLEKVVTVTLPHYKLPDTIDDFYELEEGDFGQFIRELIDEASIA